jgi:hypothetical protein
MKIPPATIVRDGKELHLEFEAPGKAAISLTDRSSHTCAIPLEAADLRYLIDTLAWMIGYPQDQSLSEAVFRLGPWVDPASTVDPGAAQRQAERSLIELRVTHVLTLFEGNLLGVDLDEDAKNFMVKTLRFIVAGGV